MKYIEILERFREKKINYFSLQDFQEITGLSYDAARAILKRYKKKGLAVNPKRGYYFFKDYAPGIYELASKLYFPSYISMETVLAREGIIPETIYPVVSVTPKPTRVFICGGQEYCYQKIKKEAFGGYFKKENYLIAEKEKAVVDYLYFVALGQKKLNSRLNLRRVEKKKLIEYAKLFGNQKLLALVKEYA